VQGFHGRRGVKPYQQQLYIVMSQVCPQLSTGVPFRFPGCAWRIALSTLF